MRLNVKIKEPINLPMKKEVEAIAKDFTTNIVIGGRISPSLQKTFSVAGAYASKTASIIESTSGRMVRATESLQNKMASVGNAVKKVAVVGGILGGAATVGGKAMLDQASSLEQYRNTLNVVMKDQKKAGETFAWAVDFANKTPYETDDIVQATVKLQSYGLEAQKVMPMIGDMAAAMGKDVDQAVEAVADAQTGELERLKEFGITKQMIVDQANKTMRGKQIVNNKGQITDQKAFNEALFSLMQERYKGAMDIQSKSWNGLMSTISGIAKNGIARIAGISQTGEIIPGSAFDIAKQKAGQLADAFTKLQESGKFDELQKQFAKLVTTGFQKIEEITPKVVEFSQKVISNGPQIIDIVKRIGVGFLAWKSISLVASGIQTISILVGALNILRNSFLLLSIAKAKDKIETLYLQALYTKDAVLLGTKTAAMWLQTTATTALSTAHTFLTGTLIPSTVAIASGTASFIANTAAKTANVTATVLMTTASIAWNAVCVVGTALTTAFGVAIAFLTSPIGIVIVAVGALIGAIVLLVNNWSTVSSAASSMWEGIKSAFASGVNWVIGKINALIEKINAIPGINIPLVDTIGGSNSSGSVDAYANGGIARKASIFGEAGPEMAIPLKPKSARSISLLNKTAEILGVSPSTGGGGNNFIFSPNITGNSTPEIQAALGLSFEEFKAWIKRYFHEEGREAF
ncbi:MAG: tape measure protein [Clostridiaceae bacterium]